MQIQVVMDKGCIMEKEIKREGKNCVTFLKNFMD